MNVEVEWDEIHDIPINGTLVSILTLFHSIGTLISTFMLTSTVVYANIPLPPHTMIDHSCGFACQGLLLDRAHDGDCLKR